MKKLQCILDKIYTFKLMPILMPYGVLMEWALCFQFVCDHRLFCTSVPIPLVHLRFSKSGKYFLWIPTVDRAWVTHLWLSVLVPSRDLKSDLPQERGLHSERWWFAFSPGLRTWDFETIFMGACWEAIANMSFLEVKCYVENRPKFSIITTYHYRFLLNSSTQDVTGPKTPKRPMGLFL